MELRESDAKHIGISDGEQIRVSSASGDVTAVAKLTDTLPEGVVFMPICFPQVPVNRLFDIALDPRAKTPALKACAVKLERIEPRE